MWNRFYPDGAAGTFATGGVGLALAIALGLSGTGAAEDPAARAPAPAPYEQSIVGTGLHCEEYAGVAGLDKSPSSAVIRNAGGDLTVVPFDRGWDVYTGRVPGELLAVCTPSGRADFGPVS